MTRNSAMVAIACLAVGVISASVILSARANSKSETGYSPPSSAATMAHQAHGKQLWHCGMHPQVIQDHPGDCPICHMALTPLNSSFSAANDAPKKVLYWWDPMLGPSSISDHPGKSAMGMDMVPVYADKAAAGAEVTIDPTVVQNMGVQTAVVTHGPLHKTIRAVGVFMLPEPGLHDISLKVGGWINKLYADQEGMHVHRGEPLFALYSQDLQVAEQELISAVQSKRLLGTDASSSLVKEADDLIESAQRKLQLWDVDEQEIDAIAKAARPPRDVVFHSPATGHVEEKMIVQGSAVQPGMKLMRIADHTTMWLEAEVYEEQIPHVRIGQRVEATVDAIPGKTFKGNVTFIYPHIDHMTRTLRVRSTFDNPGFELKPGMYADANVITEPVPDAMQVPQEAVIDTGIKQIVFVAAGGGHFSPRTVRAGIRGDDDRLQILEGLALGETVVTSGQFLMDVESRTNEAIAKLRGLPAMDSRAMPPANPTPSAASQSADPPMATDPMPQPQKSR
jgi:Cu(I)/Ag(I) efflux system membrane fusion protein/cobalt-zinc-cadmium efflux system membrane fusion protein